jgi:hypothetical protein
VRDHAHYCSHVINMWITCRRQMRVRSTSRVHSWTRYFGSTSAWSLPPGSSGYLYRLICLDPEPSTSKCAYSEANSSLYVVLSSAHHQVLYHLSSRSLAPLLQMHMYIESFQPENLGSIRYDAPHVCDLFLYTTGKDIQFSRPGPTCNLFTPANSFSLLSVGSLCKKIPHP